MDVPRLLVRLSKKEGSQQALARRIDVDPTYLGQVISGVKEPGPSILEPLGLERIVTYRRKREPQ